MKTRVKLSLALLAFLISPLVPASTLTAKIAAILLFETGQVVYRYPVGGVIGAPSCHGSNGNYYSFSLNRSYAKEYLAALLAAQASGASVAFYGTGTCTDQSVSETLNYFTVISQ